ncbi:hypothetical protein OG203_35600 [Nocardia sp. NBC_01499]|uniref:nSTAND1 domain-containing NTPase n=1 Tax=Nocardia sp. NBC_01499 TaxID=2903597 RepID=UPI00386E7798
MDIEETKTAGANPREVLAESFAQLYTAAGEPPLARLAAEVSEVQRRRYQGAVPIKVTGPRISEWRNGRRVPARFDAFQLVLEVLVKHALSKSVPAPRPGMYEMRWWSQLWEQARAATSGDGDNGKPADTAAPTQSTCPYLGLAPYEIEDSDRFFGRSKHISELVAVTRAALSQSSDGTIVSLIAASGAGKSSLLRAGLVPAAHRGLLRLDPGETWSTILLVPGRHPLAALGDRIQQALDATDRVLIVVDQLEEIFTLCTDEDERAAFITALAAASTPAPGDSTARCAVVVGVRADFYSYCLAYPELADSVQRRAMVLRPMNLGELRDVILSPARSAGLRVEPALVDMILHDFGAVSGTKQSLATPASMPLLSHVLATTWRQRENGVRLTVKGYRSAGGISGAVTVTGEQAWARLDDASKVVAEDLLLRLVHVGDDAADTRRRVPIDELIGHSSDPRATRAALEVFTDARLVTIDAELVEFTHEAVITSWDRLRKLIDVNRSGNIVRQRVEEAAKEWDSAGRDKQLLYTGHRLGQAVEWSEAARSRQHLAGLSSEFLSASQHQRQWVNRLKVAAIAALAILMVIATTSATYAVRQARISAEQRDNAVFTSLLAQADDVRANDPNLAAKLILVANQLRPKDPQVYSRMLAAQNYPMAASLPGHTGAVYMVAHSPNGQVLASASNDSTVRLWDTTDPADYRPLGASLPTQQGWVSSVAFSKDGQFLAAGTESGVIYLWNVSDPEHPRQVGAPIDAGCSSIFTVAFHPRLPILALACRDSTIRLWSISDHPTLSRVISGAKNAVRTLAFSPDGRLLAAGGNDTTISLWDVTDPMAPTSLGPPLTGFTDISHSVAFSPDSRLLAAGSDDHTVKLWDVTTPATPVPVGPALTNQTGPVWSVAFAPDGARLAVGSWDGTISIWDVANPAAPIPAAEPLADNSGVNSVSFDPVRGTLASGNQDGMVRIWSLPKAHIADQQAGVAMAAISPNGLHLAMKSREAGVVTWDSPNGSAQWRRDQYPIPGNSPILTMAVNPRGSVLAEAASGSGNITVWDLADAARARTPGAILPTQSKYFTGLAFDNGGRHLVASDTDQSMTIWDLTDLSRPVPLGKVTAEGSSWITTTIFDADDHMLAAGTADGRVWLWDVSDPAHPKQLGEPLTVGFPAISALAFGHDGRLLAAGSQDGSIQLFDLADPARPRRQSALAPTGAPSEISSVTFSPDGRMLAAASNNAGIQLWDTEDSDDVSAIGRSIVPVRPTRWNLQFAPDGRSLVAVGQNGGAYSWDLDPGTAVAGMCAAARATLTRQWWEHYLPAVPFRSDVC